MPGLTVTTTTTRALLSFGQADVWDTVAPRLGSVGFMCPWQDGQKIHFFKFLYHESKWEKQAVSLKTWERNIPWGLNYEIINIFVIKSILNAASEMG